MIGAVDMDLSEVIAKNIETLVSQAGISMNRFLKDNGFNTSFFNDIKKGAIPSAQKIVKIADYFGVSTDSLLGRSTQPELFLKDLPDEAIEKIKEYVDYIRSKYSPDTKV